MEGSESLHDLSVRIGEPPPTGCRDKAGEQKRGAEHSFSW